MNPEVVGGLFGVMALGSLWLFGLWVRRHAKPRAHGESRTNTGVMIGSVYDPTCFRTLNMVISDEGQSRPEIIVVNQAHNSRLLLIEGRHGLTVLEIDSEDSHADTAALN